MMANSSQNIFRVPEMNPGVSNRLMLASWVACRQATPGI